MLPTPQIKTDKRYHSSPIKVTLNKHKRLLDEEEFEDAKRDSSGSFRLRGLVLRTTVDAAEEGMIEEHDPESGVLIAFSTSTNSLSEEEGGCNVVRGVLTDSEQGVEFAFFDGTFSPSGLNT